MEQLIEEEISNSGSPQGNETEKSKQFIWNSSDGGTKKSKKQEKKTMRKAKKPLASNNSTFMSFLGFNFLGCFEETC